MRITLGARRRAELARAGVRSFVRVSLDVVPYYAGNARFVSFCWAAAAAMGTHTCVAGIHATSSDERTPQMPPPPETMICVYPDACVVWSGMWRPNQPTLQAVFSSESKQVARTASEPFIASGDRARVPDIPGLHNNNQRRLVGTPNIRITECAHQQALPVPVSPPKPNGPLRGRQAGGLSEAEFRPRSAARRVGAPALVHQHPRVRAQAPALRAHRTGPRPGQRCAHWEEATTQSRVDSRW